MFPDSFNQDNNIADKKMPDEALSQSSVSDIERKTRFRKSSQSAYLDILLQTEAFLEDDKVIYQFVWIVKESFPSIYGVENRIISQSSFQQLTYE